MSLGIGQLASSRRSGGADPLFANVALLLHCEGANGSTTFTDNSVNVASIVAAGDARISNAQAKFGSTSGRFDGTGDTISCADTSIVDLPADYTLETWFYLLVAPAFLSGVSLVSVGGSDSTVKEPSIAVANFGSTVLLANTDAGAITGSTVVSINTWHHAAMTRQSGTTRLFLDGVLQGTPVTDSTNFTDCLFNAGSSFNGYLDEIRVTKACRYTAAFTPPTSAFPDS